MIVPVPTGFLYSRCDFMKFSENHTLGIVISHNVGEVEEGGEERGMGELINGWKGLFLFIPRRHYDMSF